ncbi:MAG: DNA recombination protein RmuC [Candidatus Bipolaricaulota bacterium]|nr:DNA recombination protein RmuC [Candidatus Bipolaricaulota bacterium]
MTFGRQGVRMEWVLPAVGLIVGAGLGAAVAHLRAQARLAALTAELSAKNEALEGLEALRAENDRLRVEATRADAERAAASERVLWVDKAQESLREVFAALASSALTANAEQYLTRSREQLGGLLDKVRGDWGTQKEELKGLVAPLEKSLTALDGQIATMEKNRATAYGTIEQHISGLLSAQSQLQTTTTTLSQAMKSSTARGRWGEVQLRRIVELAGMEDHIDFDEQAATDEGRPDMIVHLPNGGSIPIDAKASAAAYFEALNLDGEARRAKLAEHARAMRSRMKELASRQYGGKSKESTGLVVMFVPIESALSAAYEDDANLFEYGLDLTPRILTATPVTLYALLRTAAFGWDQVRMAENAQAIADEARKLCDLVANVATPFRAVGKHLDESVDAYNKAVGSLEGRLLPGARRLKDMMASEKPLPELEPIDHAPRLPLDEGT